MSKVLSKGVSRKFIVLLRRELREQSALAGDAKHPDENAAGDRQENDV